ncbi:MAG: dethiobiotin synthase [Desulfobacterales bacterium]|nr:dethiobiotin synthase [Desulfobacterales bacterium]MBF0397839.1 dethiobiotin synthase [Desulfobacterales bacterium]
MKNSVSDFFVTGTDTGVGKTVLSLLLMKFFFGKGLSPFYFKPLQTGCKNVYDVDSDSNFIYKHIPELVNKDPEDSVAFCYSQPKAPYFAAKNEGKNINTGKILEILEDKRKFYNPLIIEGAGGLLVPICENFLNIDLIKLTRAEIILAARAGLGTINHTLLSIESLDKRGLKPIAIILMESSQSATSSDMIYENIEAIENFSKIKVAGFIPKIHDFSKIDIYIDFSKLYPAY